jgi:hypothetical protein
MATQKNILILIGIISLAYVIILLLSSHDIANYTIADTGYWGETGNRLFLKTAYEYNNKTDIQSFPEKLGDWNGMDYKFDESVYKTLNADVLMSRAYSKPSGDLIYMNIINSNVGESFHKQKLCITSAGWAINNESTAEFKIADYPNPYTKLFTNRLDISKDGEQQVMVYWFMFKQFGSADAVTMIRISSPVENNNTNIAFSSIRDFLENQLFGTMYKGADAKQVTTVEYILRQYGNKGIFAILISVLMPLGIIIIGINKKSR